MIVHSFSVLGFLQTAQVLVLWGQNKDEIKPRDGVVGSDTQLGRPGVGVPWGQLQSPRSHPYVVRSRVTSPSPSM